MTESLDEDVVSHLPPKWLIRYTYALRIGERKSLVDRKPNAPARWQASASTVDTTLGGTVHLHPLASTAP